MTPQQMKDRGILAPDGDTTDVLTQQIADAFAEAVDAVEGATRTVRVFIPAHPIALPPHSFDDVTAATDSGVMCIVDSVDAQDPLSIEPCEGGVLFTYDLIVTEGREHVAACRRAAGRQGGSIEKCSTFNERVMTHSQGRMYEKDKYVHNGNHNVFVRTSGGADLIISSANTFDIDRLIACWNACEGVQMEDLEATTILARSKGGAA